MIRDPEQKNISLQVSEITKEIYVEMLNVPSIVDYNWDEISCSFKISKNIANNINNIYCCQMEQRFFCFADKLNLTHNKIVNKVKNSFAYQNTSPPILLMALNKDEIELIFKGEKKILFRLDHFSPYIENSLVYMYDKEEKAVVGRFEIDGFVVNCNGSIWCELEKVYDSFLKNYKREDFDKEFSRFKRLTALIVKNVSVFKSKISEQRLIEKNIRLPLSHVILKEKI